MKRFLSILISSALLIGVLGGCGAKEETTEQTNETTTEETTENTEADADKVITVGATPTPHAEILTQIKDALAEQGYELKIVEFTDYVQPNMALENGELDANFFQHKPYLDDFNAEKGTNLVSVAAVHYEPLALYPGKTASIEELKEGAQIAVPNDTTNEARALLLLQDLGLIKLDESKGLKATKQDITENKLNIEIYEAEAAQLARSLSSVDMAVINGNFAMQADLSAEEDSIAKEEKDSLAAETYANVIAVKAGNEETEKTKALVNAILSDDVRTYIDETYKGAVVAKF